MSGGVVDDRGMVTACPSCGQKNRQVFRQLGSAMRCGRCQVVLPAISSAVHVQSEQQFAALVRESALPVLVDFWAPWCGPCRIVAPELERVAHDMAGRLVVAKVNTEDLPATAGRYGVRSIPTMAVFAGGREVGRHVGAESAAGIHAFVEQALQRAGVRA